MKKKEYIARYGEVAWEKRLAQMLTWNAEHPEAVRAAHVRSGVEHSRKGGKHYNQWSEYQKTGLQGARNKIRAIHRYMWRQYKNIIAPSSQIHHEWIPDTADYRGVALVEADQHMYGFIDVIEVLAGKIWLLTEAEVKNGGKVA